MIDRRRILQALSAVCLAGCNRWARATLPSTPRSGEAAAAREAPLLDAHVHLSSPRMLAALERQMGASPWLAGRDVESLIERLDREGIRRAWVLSEAYLMASDVWQLTEPEEEPAQVRAENDFLARVAARYPDRLDAFLSLNPKREYAGEEIDRCVEELGMRGLKLHCWNSLVDVRDASHLGRLRAVLARAAARGLPVMVHAFNGSVPGYGRQDVEIWARDLVLPLPDLRICFAHLGGAGGFAPPVQSVLAALVDELGPQSAAADRVGVDLSAVLLGDNTIGLPPTPPEERTRMAELLDSWGCQRVLWGSDSLPGYLELSRAAWPLGRDRWSTLCAASGDRFMARRKVGR